MGILSTYFQEYIYAKHLIPFKASENSFYIPENDQIRPKMTKNYQKSCTIRHLYRIAKGNLISLSKKMHEIRGWVGGRT